MHEPANLLTEAHHLPVEEFPWGTLQWLASGKLFAGAAQTLGRCRIYPGQGNPLHYHPNCEEILHVFSGKCRHSLDGQWVDLGPGMTIRIPANVSHSLINDGKEEVVCLIAFSSGDRQTVFLE